MKTHTNQERRKSPRIKGKFVMLYKKEGPQEDYDLSLTKNISEGGVLLPTGREFGEGTTLVLLGRFPFDPFRKTYLLGRVISSKKILGHIYATRIEFVNQGEPIYAKLGEFVQNKNKEDQRIS